MEGSKGRMSVFDDVRFGRPATSTCVDVGKQSISVSGTTEETSLIALHPK
jgi:hypothetical protein